MSLFSPDSASEDIRTLTGITDADYNYDALKPYIEIATDELIKIISIEVYNAIKSFQENSEHQELVSKAKRSIAFKTLMSLAPLKDLAFSNQGRFMRSDEHMKSPFEWQVQRHDQYLESTYYKSLDLLIEALDAENPTIDQDKSTKWKDTEVYKNSFDILFRTTEEFNQYFTIESRYLLMKLAPGLRKIQAEHVVPIMTKELYNQYIEALKNGDEIENPQILNLMKEACAYLSLAWAIPRMSAVLFPHGVIQNYIVTSGSISNGKQFPQKNEIGVVTLLFKEDGNKALMRLEELLAPKANPDDPLFEFEIDKRKKYIST